MKGSSVPPPTVRRASVDGVSLMYLEQGQGAPVVFVHGMLSDYRIWEAQREPVSIQSSTLPDIPKNPLDLCTRFLLTT